VAATIPSQSTVDDALAALDRVVAALPGAETRAGQREMCAAVARAFEEHRHLLVEAPTGTGKSIAYAVAAVLHALRLRAAADSREEDGERARVLITTATKALQEQLCDEDLPALQRVLGDAGIEFSFTLLKGRANYACAAKLDELANGAEPEEMFAPTKKESARADALTQLRKWAASSETGDRAELDADVADDLWDAVSTSSRDCPGTTVCPAGDRCQAEAARVRAQGSDVVVVNTALYGAHLAAGGFVLPQHDAVVVDEAHLSEDVFADQFGFDIHSGRLRHLAALIEGAANALEAADRLRRAGKRLDEVCTTAAAPADPRVRACDGPLAEVLATVGSAVADALQKLKAATPEPGSGLAARKSRAEKAASSLAHEVGLALDDGTYDSHVAWCEIHNGIARLVVMPVVVGDLLSTRLLPNATMVATSATLAIGGKFDAVANRFGLGRDDGWDGVQVPCPFDFRAQAMLYVPKHLPDPRAAGAADAVADELHSLIVAAGGRTLALFTSWSALRAAADRCAAHGDYEVLRQGDQPRRVLVDALKSRADSGGVAVFATMGFWTGVDVAGVALSLVAIDRIPFPRPNEPLHAARRERAVQQGLDPFATVDVPRAAMLLAQGAGRLIRHREDRGVVAVLDKRLATAPYRKPILDSMPPYRRSIDGDAVRAFLRDITPD
jgi:ATP-dependent DNA helicase DinG